MEKVNRINQYEAEHMDDYIIETLMAVVKPSIESNNIKFLIDNWEELKIILKVVYYSTLLFGRGWTEGQSIFNVRFNEHTLKLQKALFICTKIVLPYLIKKFEDYTLKNEWSGSNSFLKKLLVILFKILKFLLKFLELCNFFNFLRKNEYPTLWHRILKIKYSYIDSKRQSSMSYNFLLKKVVWAELLKVFTTILNVGVGKNFLRSIFNQFLYADEGKEKKEIEQGKICGICNTPPKLPFKGDCEHIFCYYCLTSYLKQSSNCPICYVEIKDSKFSNKLE